MTIPMSQLPQPMYVLSGPTLRDYFAAAALPAYIAAVHNDPEVTLIQADTIDEVAAICYSYADAMLKEREK